MPFVAIDKETNSRINILQVENPRLTLAKKNMICQVCGKPVFIRNRNGYLIHFFHTGECEGDIYKKHSGETPEHQFCKIEVERLLKEQFQGQNIQIFQEFFIKKINQIADVLIEFPMGWRLAHEIQLSNIHKDEIVSRTQGYESLGIDVIWWLGNKVNDEIRNWCEERYGNVFTIRIIKDEEDKPVSFSEFC